MARVCIYYSLCYLPGYLSRPWRIMRYTPTKPSVPDAYKFPSHACKHCPQFRNRAEEKSNSPNADNQLF
jgi:hypothetical protein